MTRRDAEFLSNMALFCVVDAIIAVATWVSGYHWLAIIPAVCSVVIAHGIAHDPSFRELRDRFRRR